MSAVCACGGGLLQAFGAFILLDLEPGDIGCAVTEPPQAGLKNRGVRHLAERRIARVMVFLKRIIASGVVAADHGPARVVRVVLIGPMKQVCVEKQHVAWIHFNVDAFEHLLSFAHALRIGAGLIAGQHMIHAAQLMRSLENLHAAVLPGRVEAVDTTRAADLVTVRAVSISPRILVRASKLLRAGGELFVFGFPASHRNAIAPFTEIRTFQLLPGSPSELAVLCGG